MPPTMNLNEILLIVSFRQQLHTLFEVFLKLSFLRMVLFCDDLSFVVGILDALGALEQRRRWSRKIVSLVLVRNVRFLFFVGFQLQKDFRNDIQLRPVLFQLLEVAALQLRETAAVTSLQILEVLFELHEAAPDVFLEDLLDWRTFRCSHLPS